MQNLILLFKILDLGHRFSFYFNIKLHLDDIKVLHNIKQKLEVGKIYTHKIRLLLELASMKNYRNYLIF